MSDFHSDVRISKQSANKPPPRVLGINVEKPKFPQYAVISKRKESFKSWPEYLPVQVEDMVEAGLVYTGVGDSVRCYFCGGGLRHWEQGDVPMEEHAKYYPKCPHVLLVKGKEYVDKLFRGEKPETDGADVWNKPNTMNLTELTDSVAAQSCIDMGYSKQIIKKAINVFIKRHGNNHFKGRDLCEIIFDIEGNPEMYNSDVDDKTEEEEEETQTNQVEESLETLETLLVENERLKDQYLCKICLERRVDVIFLPCGHMVSCPQCAPALTNCPICRRTINGTLKAFLSIINTRK